MTTEQAAKLCWEWQQALRLQDWTVDIKVCRHYDMGTDHRGEVFPQEDLKNARISIVDPNDIETGHRIPYDPEETIVHELLHLHFAPFWRDKKHTEQEQAINCIAAALVAAKRAKPAK